jgi:hypothetical protein
MTTDTEHKESVQEAVDINEEPPVVLEELVEFIHERVRDDMTSCPVCDLLVPISARHCRYCESDIEANNALVRETLRHIEELTVQLNDDGRILNRAWYSIKNRMRRMFGREATINGNVSGDDSQRVLTGVQAGDQVTVVAAHGAWVLVRTADGREGWIYSLSTN